MNIYDHFSSKDVVSSEIDISCIGAFDGLHLGHLELIKSTVNYSKNFQIITFDTLPKIFFNKKLKPILTNTLRNNIFCSHLKCSHDYISIESVEIISLVSFVFGTLLAIHPMSCFLMSLSGATVLPSFLKVR